MRLWTRLKDFGPWSRARRERDLEQEIRNHLELEAEETGADPDAARRAFGSVTLAKEDVRAVWGWARAEQFARDVRYGLRQVRRNPTFSAIAIATLALGIGVNTAMFSAVDAVLIRPLPYVDADRLVMIWDEMSYIGFPKHVSTPAEWRQWRRLNTVFTDIAATDSASFTLSGDGEPEQLPGCRVTGNFWPLLGVRPLLGRVFTEDEDTRGVKVAVLSHGLWMRKFGGSPDALGRMITLNDTPHEVIGVMPRDFYFLPARDVELWTPTSFSPQLLGHFSWHTLAIVARMKPGVTLSEVRASMDALSLRVTADLDRARSAVAVPLREEMAGKTHTSLIVLLGASAAVLLIACVNLANLLLARGAVRRREVAVRAALGAGRGRLIAQFLIESLVLAGLGAIAGLAVAIPVMRFLETLVPETMAAVHLTLDWRVLIFSAAIAIAAGLAFGLAPALGGWRRALQEGLRDGGRGSAGARSHWFQQSLIVIETALAVVLLTCGGLLLQTFQHLRQLDLGIRGEQMLTLETPLFRYPDFEKRVAFVNAQLEAVRAIPGVTGAAAISRIPLTELAQTTRYSFPGQPDEDTRTQDALSRVVTRDFFVTVGARLREGRFFEPSDRLSPSPVAIVNESFADRNFAGRSALGAQIQVRTSGPERPSLHHRRRGEGDSRARRGGGVEAGDLSRARTRRSNQRQPQRHRRAHVAPSGVDRAVGASGDLVGRQEPADHARPDFRGHRRASAVGADAEYGAAWGVRVACAAAGVVGVVRRALACGDAAHQRNRRPHGAGCDLGRHLAHVQQTRPRADGRRPRHRPRAVARRRASDEHAVLRLPARLRAGHHDRVVHPARRGRARLPHPGAAGFAHRPDARVATRIGSGNQLTSIAVIGAMIG
jgi:putative ABC transport system permease protein